jgi:hypothetical protein
MKVSLTLGWYFTAWTRRKHRPRVTVWKGAGAVKPALLMSESRRRGP